VVTPSATERLRDRFISFREYEVVVMSLRTALMALAMLAPLAIAAAQNGTAGWTLLYCYTDHDARSLSRAVSIGDSRTLGRLKPAA
jgi:hypothetical protein